MRLRIVITALAPWAVLLPLSGIALVVAHIVFVIAALHGAGLALAHSVGRPDLPPMLRIQLGIAVAIAILGVAIGLEHGGAAMQVVLACVFVGAHTALMGLRLARTPGESTPSLVLGPTLLLVAWGTVLLLGAAGDVGGRPFDDDGHLLAQLQRLRDTGALTDGVGYARMSQLGGQVAIASLVTVAADVHIARVLEPLAFVLVLGLVLTRLARTGREGPTWGAVLVVCAASLGVGPVDPVSCWTAVGLVLALHAMIEDADPPEIPIGVVAGAILTLRDELAPLAITALFASWWRLRGDPRRVTALLVTAAIVVVPYAMARAVADVPGEVVPLRWTPARALAFLYSAIAGGGLWFLLRRHALGWVFAGAIVVTGGIAAQITGARPYALRFLWPVVFIVALIGVGELGRRAVHRAVGLLVALTFVATIHYGRTMGGRRGWARRVLDAAANIEYLRHHGVQAPIGSGYESALDKVPRDAIIAVWVTRPERLDYSRHHIIDLRTPRAIQVIDAATLIAATGATYLLVEPGHSGLDLIADRAVLVDTQPGVRLVTLTP